MNDSGRPLAQFDWSDRRRVRTICTNKRERCFARNTGAAIAKGDYLGFLDDDDWLLPGALRALRELALRHKDAVWLYGGIRVMDENGTIVGEVNSGLSEDCFSQITGGGWAPIQTSLVRSDVFFKVGGYDPLILGTEDLDLTRRIAWHGNFANTPAVVACLLRGGTWKTSTHDKRATVDTHRSRDELLIETGSFLRLLGTAGSSYWYGRNVKVYLSTTAYNFRRKHLFRGVSRFLFMLLALLGSGKHVFASGFWRGVKDHHVPDTLHVLMAGYNHRTML